MIILDTSGLLAAIDASQRHHRAAADASLVVLAERHDTAEILTLDERHFRAVPGSRGRRFRFRPADD